MRRLYLFFVVNIFVLCSFGQTITSIVDVDKYTGRLSLSIPLASVSSKHLTADVALVYTGGGGIKHQEYASEAGLGWQLSGGYSITRRVRGYPDEFPNGYIGTGQHGHVVKNSVANNGSVSFDYFSYYNLALEQKDQVYDSEPDLFYLSTPTFSISFTFDESGNVVTPNSNGIKITPIYIVNSSNYSNSRFEVVDDKGNAYYFGTNNNYKSFNKEILFGENETEYISTWHLEKIVSVKDANDHISFQYTNFNSSGYYDQYLSYSKVRFSSSNGPTTIKENETSQGQRNRYLTGIATSAGQTVVLEYLTGRQDIFSMDSQGNKINTVPRITSISTSVYNMLLRTLSFEHSYFGSIVASDPTERANKSRLRLDRIRVAESGQQVPRLYTEFTYANPSASCDRQYDQLDYFGFRTILSGDAMSFPTYRGNYNLDQTRTFALTDLTELSGASATVIYELNTRQSSSLSVNGEPIGGIRIKQLTFRESEDSSSMSRHYQYDFGNQSSGMLLNEFYNDLSMTAIVAGQSSKVVFSQSPSISEDLGGNFLAYSHIREILPNESYIDYYFNGFSDFPDLGDVSAVGDVANEQQQLRSVSYAHKRALPKKRQLFSKTNRLVQETEYLYSALSVPAGKASYGFVYREYINANNGTGKKHIVLNDYYTPTDDYRLVKTINREYDDQDNIMESEIQYGYHPNRYLIRTLSNKDSKGVVHSKTMYYPEDGANVPFVQPSEQTTLSQMSAANIKNVVVHEVSESDAANSPVFRLHHKYDMPFKLTETTAYKEIVGELTPVTLSATKNYYDPANRMSMSTSNSINFRSVAYDVMENVSVEIDNARSQRLDGVSSNTYYEFYYEGFEHTLSTYGSSNTYAGFGSSPTPFPIPFTKENNRNYLIDYRYYDPSTSNWKYKKLRYTDNFVITDGTRVDEIRVYPEDADINTYTYNGTGLKASETNVTGIAMFYEYDEKRRLSIVLDQDKNIVRSYCYNLKGENVDCLPDVPGNNVQQREFYKQGCPTGYYGEAVTYTVPANTYGGADANARAQDDVDQNGQAYADLHGQCLPYGTFVSVCQTGAREEISGYFKNTYATFTIYITQDPYRTVPKPGLTSVSWSWYPNDPATILLATASTTVGEFIIHQEYIGPPHPDPVTQPAPGLFPSFVTIHPQPHYEIVVPKNCFDDLIIDPDPNPFPVFVLTRMVPGDNDMLRFDTLDELCLYSSGMEDSVTLVYYDLPYFADPPVTVGMCYTDSSMQTFTPNGYYVVFRSQDMSDNYYYKITNGVVEEEGYCQSPLIIY